MDLLTCNIMTFSSDCDFLKIKLEIYVEQVVQMTLCTAKSTLDKKLNFFAGQVCLTRCRVVCKHYYSPSIININ